MYFVGHFGHRIAAIAFAVAVLPGFAQATPTRVGNGDNGTDLEVARKVTTGLLVETRNDALSRVVKLNAQNVPGLGRLLVELEKSEIQYVAHDVKPTADAGASEAEHNGEQVYARTFAEPVAPTRFFPAALLLEREQLVALHIHEALHRALPEDMREDESVVSQMTLALSTADSTHDRVQATMAKVLYAKRESAAPSKVSSADLAPTIRGSRPGESRSIWSVKFDGVKFVDRLSSRLNVGTEVANELMPEISFSRMGPLKNTKFTAYWASIIQSGDPMPNSGPAGLKVSSRIFEGDESIIDATYRYASPASATIQFRNFKYGRMVQEYGLTYTSKADSWIRWSHSLAVIEGTSAVGRSDDYYTSGFAGRHGLITSYGSALTYKVSPRMQINGNRQNQTGLFFTPSYEFISSQPTERVAFDDGITISRDSGSYFPDDSLPEAFMGVGGLGFDWRSKRSSFGFELKMASASSQYRPDRIGDYWEHGFSGFFVGTTLTVAL